MNCPSLSISAMLSMPRTPLTAFSIGIVAGGTSKEAAYTLMLRRRPTDESSEVDFARLAAAGAKADVGTASGAAAPSASGIVTPLANAGRSTGVFALCAPQRFRDPPPWCTCAPRRLRFAGWLEVDRNLKKKIGCVAGRQSLGRGPVVVLSSRALECVAGGGPRSAASAARVHARGAGGPEGEPTRAPGSLECRWPPKGASTRVSNLAGGGCPIEGLGGCWRSRSCQLCDGPRARRKVLARRAVRRLQTIRSS